MDKGWLKVKSAAAYADIGERTIRRWINEGLRYVRMPSGTILIKRQWVDEFIGQFEDSGQVDQIVNSITGSM